MIIENLKLINYRNYNLFEVKLNSRLNFIIGENGSGKTNILESIQILSTLKSFRDNSDDELINWGNNNYFISAKVKKKDNISYNFEVGFIKEGIRKKKIKINSKEFQKRYDFIGELITITFTPNDLKIVEGGPIERRKFIDVIISLSNKSYLINLLDYNKILKNRNTLLKNSNINTKELDVWDELLIEKGVYIIQERIKTVDYLNNIFKIHINKLSGGRDDFNLDYRPNVSNIDDFKNRMISKRKVDMKIGYTTTGPHRDNLSIGENQKDLLEFASQGQKRTTVIALKIAQYYYFKDILNLDPILLIDDVIRELDIKRRNYFLDILINSGQVLFTTTDLQGLEDFLNKFSDQYSILKINQGQMKDEI
jgi:DNA replication and repair protein RecF